MGKHLPHIETDPDMPSREYIPLPGGWEVQTKGNGSSYRICDTKTGERRNFTETYLHAFFTRMAKEVHAEASAYLAALEEIASSDDVDNALDPERNKRVARAALAAVREGQPK